MQSVVFAPSHITGFFEIIDHPNPLIRGSRGAGVVLDQGVTTRLNISEGSGETIIKTSGKLSGQKHPLEDSVTYKTIDLLRQKFPKEIKWDDLKINIQHETQVPIEAGFGVSAGFALGTALALSKLLKLPLTFNQAAAVAHHAEVELKTGMGDVMGAVVGGFPIRLEPGAPGYGKADKILSGTKNNDNNNEEENGLFVISKSLGTIETSSVLRDPAMTSKVNTVAHHLLGKLLSNPHVTHFMDLSLNFSQETGLIDPEVMEIVEVLKDETMGASMAMLGKTAFAISETPDSSVEGTMVARVDDCGCRIE
ncbi:pantoate kinase [Methanobacterium petrolearium]|uniref:pantoate kinase n=1 Tax=Methanobacterium petrolearium TaxID=710190 RepID=UPI001AE1FCF1|nr:GHMP kinase [Methanobacterium petrolearium]MBP1946703.1 pantoate kinase [Methanobacterium petrolearium]BDZ70950.1 kinase [Methanobacterium petrolearium]